MKQKTSFEEIKKLIKAGLSVKEINEKLGLSENVVYSSLSYNGTTLAKLRAGIETVSNKRKKPVEKKEDKVGTPTTTPAWITIYRKEWEEECKNEPNHTLRAWITNRYKEKSGINFSEEKKQIEKDNKNKLKQEKKAKKQADVERIKLEKQQNKKEIKKAIERVNNLPFKYKEYTPANEVKRLNVSLMAQNASQKAEIKSLKLELESYKAKEKYSRKAA